MKSLEDLERVKKEALNELRVRDSSGCPRVVIGMGTCGIAAGSRDTMLAIIDELKKRHKMDVTVGETGCIGLCVKEPVVEVTIPGQQKVVYGNVDASRARQIVASHLINRQPVTDWIINTQKDES